MIHISTSTTKPPSAESILGAKIHEESGETDFIAHNLDFDHYDLHRQHGVVLLV